MVGVVGCLGGGQVFSRVVLIGYDCFWWCFVSCYWQVDDIGDSGRHCGLCGGQGWVGEKRSMQSVVICVVAI